MKRPVYENIWTLNSL